MKTTSALCGDEHGTDFGTRSSDPGPPSGGSGDTTTHEPTPRPEAVAAGAPAIIAMPIPNAPVSADQEVTVYVPKVEQELSLGMWAGGSFFPAGIVVNGPLPDAVIPQTIGLCHERDLVCGTYPGAWWTAHENYTGGELRALAYLLWKQLPGSY